MDPIYLSKLKEQYKKEKKTKKSQKSKLRSLKLSMEAWWCKQSVRQTPDKTIMSLGPGSVTTVVSLDKKLSSTPSPSRVINEYCQHTCTAGVIQQWPSLPSWVRSSTLSRFIRFDTRISSGLVCPSGLCALRCLLYLDKSVPWDFGLAAGNYIPWTLLLCLS